MKTKTMKTKILLLVSLLLIVPLAALLAYRMTHIHNPVQIASDRQSVVTHVLQLWSGPSSPMLFAVEGRVYTDLDKVVARIGELMKQKPVPYIRVRVGPPAWGRGVGQKVLDDLGARCRKIGFINLEFRYDLIEPPKDGQLK